MSPVAAGAPRRLHPASLIARWLRIVPQMAGGAAAYAAAAGGWDRLLAIAAIAGLAGIAVALLSWWRFRYLVGDGEIVVESGVLQRQRRVIPFSRVQDIAIERPPLARLFGTARVKIETGGSAADEGSLDMIALAEAQGLRDLIRRAPGEAPAPVAAEPVLFEMNLGRLLYAGLFNFSLLFLAAIFAVLQNLDQFGLVDLEQWDDPQRAEAVLDYVTLRATLLLIPLLILLGIVAGMVRTVTRDFGFRLTRAPAGFRRRRGLFTLSEVVIPIRRAQVALIESGPVARRLGWHGLSFQTLGAERKEGGMQAAAPFARMEELLPILVEADFPEPPPRASFSHIPRRALVRWAGPWLLAGLTLTAVALAVAPGAGVGAAVLLLIGGYGALRWRRHAFALDDHALFVTHGWLKRRLWIIPFERIQTISVTQGPLQRRLRLASLLLDTAGGSLVRSPEVVDLDQEEAEALADRLLALFYEAHRRARSRP